jgi:NADH-quinone oxidoreductase subunit L
MYVVKPELPAQWASKLKTLYKLIYNKYFVDEIYEWTIVKPVVQVSRGLWAFVDVRIVDRTTYFLSDMVKGTGMGLRMMVNGSVQQYALYIVFGVLFSLIVIFAR